jgi:hypothetical protein
VLVLAASSGVGSQVEPSLSEVHVQKYSLCHAASNSERWLIEVQYTSAYDVPSVIRLAHDLGWRFRIWTDSVEGRIRADAGGIPAAPQGRCLPYFAVCMRILTLSKWIPDSDGFGRGSDWGGFLDPGNGISKPNVRPHLGVGLDELEELLLDAVLLCVERVVPVPVPRGVTFLHFSAQRKHYYWGQLGH